MRRCRCGGVLFAFWALWVAGAVCAETSLHWRFEESKAQALSPSGKAGVFEKGAQPVIDSAVSFKALWNGAGGRPTSFPNAGSLRFRAPEVTGGGAPVGGEVVVPGKDPALQPASLTVEAFVNVARLTPRHALVASKRRNGQSGASWSLSVTPSGMLGVRLDTQPGTVNGGEGFNQCFGATGALNDGCWHHVALTFDRETLQVGLYVDYQQRGKGTARGPLVYDGGDMVMGRGLDGWLDEVRLSPEVLHPEQFLRPSRFYSDMKPKTPPAVPLLDQTQTRVQSALTPGMPKLGTLIPKSVPEIDTSMWSLGCETLDRDLADWDAYRGYLVPLGIRRIRLQGGWNRTEQKKGEYDFTWLDHIVDDAHGLGLRVCLETSYNNRLYTPGGATGPGGLLPAGDETLAAWDRWVEAMARRYSAKGVKEWMMYNEPNLRKENTPELIVANNVRTAAIIKRIDPAAKVGAFVLAGLNTGMISNMLVNIRQQGRLDLFDWAIYHGYSGNPDRLNGAMAGFTAMLAAVAPKIRPWQGEAGCASEEVQYALSGIGWTEYSHAKWNARRMLCDFGYGVDSSVFCISDLRYSKDFISRYGLLKTNPDNSVIKVKTAYYAVQNVVSVFNGALTRIPDYDMTVTGTEKALSRFAFRDKRTGLDVIALWDGSEIPGNGDVVERVNVVIKGGRFKEPVWLDLITGVVYEIPPEQTTREGEAVTFGDVPVYDAPAAILDKSLLKIEPVKVAAKREKSGKALKRAEPAKSPKQSSGGVPPVVPHLLPGTQQPAPAVLILRTKDEKDESWVQWLNGQAVHVFVLEVTAQGAADAAVTRQTLRYIRSRASEWQVRPDAVGVLALGTAGAQTAAEIEGDADFAVLFSKVKPDSASAVIDKKRLVLGKEDAWEPTLSQWLGNFKGNVF